MKVLTTDRDGVDDDLLITEIVTQEDDDGAEDERGGGGEGRTKEKGTKEIEFGNLQYLDYTFSCRNSQENSDNEEGDSQLG